MTDFVQLCFAGPLLVVGTLCLIREVASPGRIGLMRLSLFAFSLQFCLGSTIAILGLVPSTMAGPQDVALAWGTTYLFWGAAFAVGSIWRVPLDEVVLHQMRGVATGRGIFAALADAALRLPVHRVVGLAILITALRFALLLIWGLGLSGSSSTEKMMSLPYGVVVLNQMVRALGLSFVFVVLVKVLYRQPGSLLTLWILPVEGLFVFMQGRRWMFAAALLALFAFLIRSGRIRTKHAAWGVVGAVLMWQIGFPFFTNMRREWQTRPDASPVAWVASAWQVTLTGGTFGERERAYKESLTKRLLAFQVNYLVADRLNTGREPMDGEILRSATIQLIPRIFYPEKLVYIGDDNMLNEFLGAGHYDQVSNLPCFALTDFGLMGGVIYGLIFGVGLRMCTVLLRALLRRQSIGAFILFSALASNVVLQMEFDLTGFLVTVRLCFVLFAVFYVFSMFRSAPAYEQDEFAYAPQV